MAVAAVMSTGLISEKLPKSWSRGWRQKQFVPFADWPSGGETYENTYAPQLLSHFKGALAIFDVPFGVDESDFKDVRNFKSRLSFKICLQNLLAPQEHPPSCSMAA